MTRLDGGHALVTGGSSGIGLATAAELARRGARLTLWARGEDQLAVAATSLRDNGVEVLAESVDVADAQAVRAAYTRAVARLGEVDILVASAGQTHPGHFLEIPDEVFRRMIEVDYFGTLYAVRAVAPSMVARRTGSIVGISSGAGLVGVFGYTAYGAAKFAVRGLFEALRDELTPYAVHVACVYPPDVDTPMFEQENRIKPAETAAIAGTVRPLPPEEVARAILRSIDRGTFAVYPGAAMGALGRFGSLAAPVLRRVVDARVRAVRKAPTTATD
jgi:3-dehydrosphinganine reductase